MKTSFKNNLLQHLIAKKEDGGFTLIELLVVIIIIGILAAIALPSFLNQANRARQSEAATYVGSINRGQQAYRLENREFADTIPRLGIGISTGTEYYDYTLEDANEHGVQTLGTPSDEVLLGYTGLVYTIQDDQDNATTTALLCKALLPGDTNVLSFTVPTTITASTGELDCDDAS